MSNSKDKKNTILQPSKERLVMCSNKDAGNVNRATELTYGCGVSLFRAAQLEWTAPQCCLTPRFIFPDLIYSSWSLSLLPPLSCYVCLFFRE